MKHILLVIAVLLCTACAEKPAEVVTVVVEPEPPNFPLECKKRDPAWKTYADDRIVREDIPRLDRTNETQYGAVLGNREVCRRVLIEMEQGKKS